jgi:hypothetical protein
MRANQTAKTIIILFLLFIFQIRVFSQSHPIPKVDSGVMIIKLGRDTIAIQQFELKGDSLHTIILRRPGGIQIYKGEGTIYPDGTLRSMHSIVFRVSANGQLQIGENKLYTTSDSTIIENNANGKTVARRSYAGRALIANDMDYTTFLVFPFLVHYAVPKINDSITGKQFVLGSQRTFTIRRTSASTLQVGSSIMGNITLQLNSDGTLHSINAIGSSLNFISTVVHNLNMDTLINSMIAYQRQTGVMAAANTRDTAKAMIGSAKIELDYWRPSMRGRKIFGGVVPYNRFWRTGANNATQLRISQPIYFNDQKLDSGRYAIFTWPTESGWTFLINKQATIWGTDYNPDFDVLRLPMKVQSIPDQVEQLTIHLVPVGNVVTIVIEWEKTRASIDFQVKN